jgi:tetratricopeptide (TPR) repeat protein
MDINQLLKCVKDGDKKVFNQITISNIDYLIDHHQPDDFSVIQTAILEFFEHQSFNTDDLNHSSLATIIDKSKLLEVSSDRLLIIHEYLYNKLNLFNEQNNLITHELKNYLNTVSKDTLAEADVYFFLARCYIDSKQEYLIEETLYKAINIYDLYAERKESKILERLGQSYRYLGEYYEQLSDYALAASCYEQATMFFNYMKDQKNESAIIRDEYIYPYVMSHYQYLKVKQKIPSFDLSELEGFIQYLRRCVKERKGYDFYLASLLYDYAEKIERDHPDEAIRLYQESLDVRHQKSTVIKQEDLAMTGFTFSKIARLYEVDKDDSKALYYYDQAFEVFQTKAQTDANYQIEVGRISYNQALIYQRNKLYEQAEYHYFIAQDAYESASEFHNKYTYDFIMNQFHFAEFYRDRMDYYNASVYFVEAANFFTTHYDKDFNRYAHYAGMSLFYASKMCILAKRDELIYSYTQAGFLILKKLYQVKGNKYIHFIAELYLIYGEYLLKHKQYPVAIENLKSAVEVFGKIYQRYEKQANDLNASYLSLIACYKALKDEESAMNIQFDYLSFLETQSLKDKAYGDQYQKHLKLMFSLLLINQVDEVAFDLIGKMKVDRKNKSLDYAILACYSLAKNNLEKGMKIFRKFKKELLNQDCFDQLEIHMIGLLNRLFEQEKCQKLMDNNLANKIIKMMQKNRKSSLLESEKEILITSAHYLNQYFQKTNQPNKIKEVESFHRY